MCRAREHDPVQNRLDFAQRETNAKLNGVIVNANTAQLGNIGGVQHRLGMSFVLGLDAQLRVAAHNLGLGLLLLGLQQLVDGRNPATCPTSCNQSATTNCFQVQGPDETTRSVDCPSRWRRVSAGGKMISWLGSYGCISATLKRDLYNRV